MGTKKEAETGGPAFPAEVAYTTAGIEDRQIGTGAYKTVGMTLRDYFAAKSHAAIISAMLGNGVEMTTQLRDMAADAAYESADSLLASRNRKPVDILAKDGAASDPCDCEGPCEANQFKGVVCDHHKAGGL